MENSYTVIGLMSGTSLDGMDIAACRLEKREQGWDYEVLAATTLPYDQVWLDRLANAPNLSGVALTRLDIEYGHYIGQKTVKFLQEQRLQPDLVASHGHTVFHQPHKGFTLQIGAGSAIASYLECPVVCNFRTVDVALGGQGAPLVPIGDQLLFPEYGACLNLGGIANISSDMGRERMAWDICPVNMALNTLAREADMPFDDEGKMARSGKIVPEFMEALNDLDFYKEEPPKSTGREWFNNSFMKPLQRFSEAPLEDRMHTVTEHIAIQLAQAIPDHATNMLMTGGGTRNTFLCDRLATHTNTELVIPDGLLIDFKEALIFALLGVLRLRNEVNCLASVTGASADNVGGAVYNG